MLEKLFFNNYKQNKCLSDDERKMRYIAELNKYQPSKRLPMLVLNNETVFKIAVDILYDFVLLPNNDIIFSEANPLGLSVGAEDVIDYPNHSILAKGEAVVTAGHFRLSHENDPAILYVSNKSGHYLPTYASLAKLSPIFEQIEEFPYQVKFLPFYDEENSLLTDRRGVEKNLLIFSVKVVEVIYNNRSKIWISSFNPQYITQILNTFLNTDCITEEQKIFLKEERKRAAYLRVAINIFEERHAKACPIFHKYTKTFGMLNDAIYAKNVPEIRKNAKLLITQLIDHTSIVNDSKVSNATSLPKISRYFNLLTRQLASFQLKEPMPLNKFHQLRKILKIYLGLLQDIAKYNLHAYSKFIEEHADVLKQIVVDMGTVHDEQIADLINGKNNGQIVMQSSLADNIELLTKNVLVNIGFE